MESERRTKTIEEFLVAYGVGYETWQVKVMQAVLDGDREEVEALAWWEEPTPVVPPSNWTKIKRWFNRVVLRRKGPDLTVFDRTLREVYAPGLRAQIEAQSPLMEMIAKRPNERAGQRITWAVRDEAT